MWKVFQSRTLVGAILFAACSNSSPSPRPMPSKPTVAPPIEGGEVEVGSLVQSQAVITLDVLVPANGDVQAALEDARKNAARDGIAIIEALPTTANQAVMTVELKNVNDEGWNHHLPGYVASKIGPDAFPDVDSSVGVVRLDARAPASHAWELLRAVTKEARDLAAAQGGWIFDPYRAELHNADTFESSIPDARTQDVRAITRIVGVINTKGGPDHVRTIGLWRLGLPELYLPDVPHAELDNAMDAVRATAQTLIQNGGVTSRGVIDVDLSKLPNDWPRSSSTSGQTAWHARWMRGPIHQNAMQIVLSPREPSSKAGAK